MDHRFFGLGLEAFTIQAHQAEQGNLFRFFFVSISDATASVPKVGWFMNYVFGLPGQIFQIAAQSAWKRNHDLV